MVQAPVAVIVGNPPFEFQADDRRRKEKLCGL